MIGLLNVDLMKQRIRYYKHACASANSLPTHIRHEAPSNVTEKRSSLMPRLRWSGPTREAAVAFSELAIVQ